MRPARTIARLRRLRGREVAIGQALGEDRFGQLAVQAEPLGLLVLFVPLQAEPAQSFKDGLHAGVGVALDVGVVEAQDHGAAVVAGVEPVEDEGSRAAHVEKTCGGGREAHSQHKYPV